MAHSIAELKRQLDQAKGRLTEAQVAVNKRQRELNAALCEEAAQNLPAGVELGKTIVEYRRVGFGTKITRALVARVEMKWGLPRLACRHIKKNGELGVREDFFTLGEIEDSYLKVRIVGTYDPA